MRLEVAVNTSYKMLSLTTAALLAGKAIVIKGLLLNQLLAEQA